jgi:hypothetical protein
MFKRSLGGVKPRPRTLLGTIVIPAPAVAIVVMKFRLETTVFPAAVVWLMSSRSLIASPFVQ